METTSPLGSAMIDDLERVLLTQEQIEERVGELGAQISKDYAGKNLLLVGILKGGIIFLSDLSRKIATPHEFDFVGAQSYKGGSMPTEQVAITKDIDTSLQDKDVIVIEDVYDTGSTLKAICEMIQIHNPRSLEICSLISKKKKHKDRMNIRYIGFEIDDVFVVGYGLDYKEQYRHLSCIGVLQPEIR